MRSLFSLFDPQWLEVLRLRSEEGFNDRAIAFLGEKGWGRSTMAVQKLEGD